MLHKRKNLQQRLDDLSEDLELAYKQQGKTLNDVDRKRLERETEDIEAAIASIKAQLNALSNTQHAQSQEGTNSERRDEASESSRHDRTEGVQVGSDVIAGDQTKADFHGSVTGSGDINITNIYQTEEPVSALGDTVTPRYQDTFSQYEIGLHRLLTQMGQNHPRYLEALGYQSRLQDNIDRSRRFGDTNERGAGRAEIVEQLNVLSLTVLGISFNALCAEAAGRSGETAVASPNTPPPKLLGNIPPQPSLVIGRENDIYYLKHRIGVGEASTSPLTVVRGWPGVGKTTTVLTLVHQPGIAAAFPDGVLWAALGENPNPFSELAAWGRALGVDDIGRLPTIEEAMARLTAVLRHKQMLLIIDDVWEAEHGMPFKIAGEKCATIFTTRFQDVARALVDIPDKQIYNLPVLTAEKALELLQTLTPETVSKHPDDSLILVRDDLEGLPLAIQVAGRLLYEEHGLGWEVADLITEIREGAKLLAANAPADRTDIVNQTTPTVAALLKKSTDTLSAEMQIHFAFLGAFAPKPATFDLAAMAAVWLADDPKPSVRVLVNRGLLEPVGERFQMHALLVTHAKSLLTDEDE